MKRLVLVVAMVAGLLISSPCSPAWACSCAAKPPEQRLARAEAAFVGTLISREEPTPEGGFYYSGQTLKWKFRVEKVAKGDLEEEIELESAASGASCGLEVRVGERAGILLHKNQQGAWQSGLCEQMDPDELLRLAPQSKGPSQEQVPQSPTGSPSTQPPQELGTPTAPPEEPSKTSGHYEGRYYAIWLPIAVGIAGLLAWLMVRRLAKLRSRPGKGGDSK